MKTSYELSQLLNPHLSISEKLNQKTKISRITSVKNQPIPETWKKIYFKGYSRFEEIILPEQHLPEISLKKSLLKRKSSRKFSSSKFSLKKMSAWLYYSVGLKENKSSPFTYRFYPSAGGRYPLEIYILTLNTELQNGIYHYYLKSHSLEKLLLINKNNLPKYFDQSWIQKSACIVIITAVFKRTTVKYGDRGYRHILIEAGHLGQNFYLTAAALNLSCCAIGGFNDDELNKLLDINGLDESVIYVLTIGNSLKP